MAHLLCLWMYLLTPQFWFVEPKRVCSNDFHRDRLWLVKTPIVDESRESL